MECSLATALLHLKGANVCISVSLSMKFRHPEMLLGDCLPKVLLCVNLHVGTLGRNPGTASLCAPLLCSIYLLFHVGNPGRNPGTAWYLFFMFSVCRESSEIDSQVKVMYVM